MPCPEHPHNAQAQQFPLLHPPWAASTTPTSPLAPIDCGIGRKTPPHTHTHTHTQPSCAPPPTCRHPCTPQCSSVISRSRCAEIEALPGYALFTPSTAPLSLLPSTTWGGGGGWGAFEQPAGKDAQRWKPCQGVFILRPPPPPQLLPSPTCGVFHSRMRMCMCMWTCKAESSANHLPPHGGQEASSKCKPGKMQAWTSTSMGSQRFFGHGNPPRPRPLAP